MSLMNFGRLVPITVLALLLTGCAAFTEDPEPTDLARGADGTLEVYASFYPLQFVTEEIGGDRVTVSALTPPGVDPHNVELSPRTVTEMGSASLVVYLSGFQPAVDDGVTATGARAFDAAEHTELLASGNGHDHDHGADDADGDDHAHADDDHGDDGADDHAHGEDDQGADDTHGDHADHAHEDHDGAGPAAVDTSASED